MSTVNKEEIQKFSKLADEWWDVNGKFKPLHAFNPIRIEYIKEKCVFHFELNNLKDKPLSAIKVLDIGCGKGFLLHEMKLLLPELDVRGFDISEHGLRQAKEEVLLIHRLASMLRRPFLGDRRLIGP